MAGGWEQVQAEAHLQPELACQPCMRGSRRGPGRSAVGVERRVPPLSLLSAATEAPSSTGATLARRGLASSSTPVYPLKSPASRSRGLKPGGGTQRGLDASQRPALAPARRYDAAVGGGPARPSPARSADEATGRRPAGANGPTGAEYPRSSAMRAQNGPFLEGLGRLRCVALQARGARLLALSGLGA